jgi:hypothetical protein
MCKKVHYICPCCQMHSGWIVHELNDACFAKVKCTKLKQTHDHELAIQDTVGSASTTTSQPAQMGKTHQLIQPVQPTQPVQATRPPQKIEANQSVKPNQVLQSTQKVANVCHTHPSGYHVHLKQNAHVGKAHLPCQRSAEQQRLAIN